MDCNQSRSLIDADLDGELDLVRHLELAGHLRTCSTCAHYAAQARARQTALRESLPRFPAPPQLATNIRAALQAEAKPNLRRAPNTSAAVGSRTSADDRSSSAVIHPSAAPSRSLSGASGPWSAGFWWKLTGLATTLAFAVLIGFAWGDIRARKNLLLDEAVNDHVRSMQAGHLVDVVSSDQHTVKPWFAGKLDFAPPVTDLASAGFPLAGGRLEHFDGRPAAALVFHRRAHAINLFIWPARETSAASKQSDRNGYNTLSWSQDGLNFLAVSEIPNAELVQFVEAYRASQR